MLNEQLFEKKKPGRRPITETVVSEKIIVETYRECHSMRKTAEKLQIALRTVLKYVRKSNASFHVGSVMVDDPLKAKQTQKIAKALDNLSGPVPQSVGKICKLLDNEYSPSAVSYFLISRRKAAEYVLRRAGDLLAHTNKQLKDIYGRTIQVGYIAQYEIVINKYNLNVTIGATLKFGGKVTCRMSFLHYKELLESTCPVQNSSSTSLCGESSLPDIL